MAYRWHPKNAEVDSDNPRAWGTCDRCGFVWNLDRLCWQYDFQGTNQLQNTRLLVCPPCYDVPQPQLAPYILPPDPPPIFNARPENYSLDEASYLLTQDGSIITTQDGTPFETSIPDPNNPSQAANTTVLFCPIVAPSGSVAVAYLDLFDGNPSSGGRSVLSAITGSSVRTDIASLLTTTGGIATNTDYLVISAASVAQTNISFAGIYTASISGALMMSGPISVSQTIALGNPVQFNPLGLSINLN